MTTKLSQTSYCHLHILQVYVVTLSTNCRVFHFLDDYIVRDTSIIFFRNESVLLLSRAIIVVAVPDFAWNFRDTVFSRYVTIRSTWWVHETIYFVIFIVNWGLWLVSLWVYGLCLTCDRNHSMRGILLNRNFIPWRIVVRNLLILYVSGSCWILKMFKFVCILYIIFIFFIFLFFIKFAHVSKFVVVRLVLELLVRSTNGPKVIFITFNSTCRRLSHLPVFFFIICATNYTSKPLSEQWWSFIVVFILLRFLLFRFFAFFRFLAFFFGLLRFLALLVVMWLDLSSSRHSL